MEKNFIIIDGEKYPMVVSMGAMLDYKHLTGEDVSRLAQDNVEGLLKLCFCCVASACRKAGKEFPFDFQTFADSITIEDMNRMSVVIMEESAGEEAKKKGRTAARARP